MKVTGTILTLIFVIYTQKGTSFEISHEQPTNNITEIPAHSANKRMMNGNVIEKGEYAYVAHIYYPHYLNNNVFGKLFELRCRGVLLAPAWVVTVANCFRVVIITMKGRKMMTNFVWQFQQLEKDGKTGLMARVRVGGNDGKGPNFTTFLDKVYIPDRFNLPEELIYSVDVAMVKLKEPVPSNIASPPRRIDDSLLSDGSRYQHQAQDCWAVAAGQTNSLHVKDAKLTWDVKVSHKMKVIVGNNQYCADLGEKLFPYLTRFSYFTEQLCAKSNDSVNPDDRACLGDEGAALVCGGRLLGLLSGTYDTGNCEAENAYAVYVYLGHSYVYNWIRGTVMGVIETQNFRSAGSDESASGLVEASKTMTLLLTVISVAVALNNYH